MLGWVGVARDRAHQGHAAARARRLHHPPHGKRERALRKGSYRTSQEKQQETGQQHRSTAETVGEAAVGERRPRHGKQRDAEVELRRGIRQVERDLDRRDCRQKQMNSKWSNQRDDAEGQCKQTARHRALVSCLAQVGRTVRLD